MGGRVFVGTSGYDFPQWRGSFYPETLRRREMLSYYAERLRSVEINYSFRHELSPETVKSWRGSTAEDFVFSVKAHQRLTHWQRLSAPDESLERFLAATRGLGRRLGPILFQTPPTLRADLPLLERFLDRLPVTMRFAFEFRHESWEPAASLLAERGVAWCVADADEAPFEAELPDGSFVYLRLRRASYEGDRLREWARRIDAVRSEGRDVFCYFKHEEAGAGARFALALVRELP